MDTPKAARQELYYVVQAQLSTRRGDWKQIARDLAPRFSYSWISKVGRGEYRSCPAAWRLEQVLNYLQASPQQ